MLTINDMFEYGYKWGGMRPLTREEARSAFLSGRCVYRLYEDDTEGMVDSFEEFDTHGGMFGVEL